MTSCDFANFVSALHSLPVSTSVNGETSPVPGLQRKAISFEIFPNLAYPVVYNMKFVVEAYLVVSNQYAFFIWLDIRTFYGVYRKHA